MAEDLAPSPGKIRVKITCPTTVIADVEGDSVEVAASLGKRLILPKMAPLFFLLKEGKVIVKRKDKSDLVYLISKGVCEVRRDICAVMAWGILERDVQKEQFETLLDDTEKAYQKLSSSVAKQEIKKRMDFSIRF